MKVELIYEKSCPNIVAARTQLLKALGAAGQPLHWQEWESSDPELPEHARGYGSPTILVNGVDVVADKRDDDSSQTTRADADCCRIYLDGDRHNKGIPAIEQITQALTAVVPQAASRTTWLTRSKNLLSFTPALLLATLPKLTCPYCWPAYAGFLSSLGLGFVDYTPYILPFTVAFLAVALFTLFYKAPQRQGYWPFVLGLAGASSLVMGKIIFESDAAMYSALLLLITASLWNSWPASSKTGAAVCPACVSEKP